MPNSFYELKCFYKKLKNLLRQEVIIDNNAIKDLKI